MTKKQHPSDKAVWRTSAGKKRVTPKGRQYDEKALKQIKTLLGDSIPRRDLLIEYLHDIQDHYGCLHETHLCALAHWMSLSQVEVYEVATFYAHFDVVKSGDVSSPKITIRVCNSLSCEMAGSEALHAELIRTHGEQIRIVRAPCMGRCQSAPVLEFGHHHIDHASVKKVNQAISNKQTKPVIPAYQTFAAYQKIGGYQSLIALRNGSKTPDEVQAELLQSGLRGMGGAGFPTGRKWSFVRAESAPRYMAVNGDEGEPGTFKDRLLLESEPHVFLEGMLIGAWAVEAQKVFIYLRDEYPAARKILQTELLHLEQNDIITANFVELRRGAGAYICGEESAMIESIEGKRGIPRHRPPFVAQNGIFGRPTLVHNIETLYWVTRVCYEGAEVLNQTTKNQRTGLRNYSVSGRIKNPGVYLLPAGSTIIDVINASGGMLAGHQFIAYQPGGPSSGLLPASLNDVPLDFDTLASHGTFIGSAAVVVLSDQDNVQKAALNMMRFFEDESCGQCTPCRVGCEKAVKLMAEDAWDKSLLTDLADTMAEASICGLGQAAANPIRSVIRYFSKEG